MLAETLKGESKVRKPTKCTLLVMLSLSVTAVAISAWAFNPTLSDLQVRTLTATRSGTVNTYVATVWHAGSDSAYNVRVAFRIPQDLLSQNTTLPSGRFYNLTDASGPVTSVVTSCSGTDTVLYGNLRTVICTAQRIDPNEQWVIHIPVSNSSGTAYIASVQVFSDTPDGNSTSWIGMDNNFKAINF